MSKIIFEHVHMAFGDKTIFSDLSLSFSSPGQYALLGPSGKGKTTLLRLIAGLERPISGNIHIPQNARICFCFQEDRLLPWKTVLENVLLAIPSSAEPKGSKGTEACCHQWRNQACGTSELQRSSRMLQLLQFPDRPESPLAGRWGRAPSPDALDLAKYWINKVGLSGEENSYPASLSGGMKRRAALARALAYDAPILLMDEPFRALDEKTHQEMLALVREAAKDKLLILVTHDESDASGMQIVRI